MKRYKHIIFFIIACIFFAMPTSTYGRNRVSVSQNMDLVKTFSQEKTSYIIKEYIDLQGKTVKVGGGSKLVFRGGSLENGTIELAERCSISAGILKNISITVSSNTVIRKCQFINPNRNTAIVTNDLSPKENISIDGCVFLNVGNSLTTTNSIHCIYLNSTCSVTLRKCSFLNIGNLYTQKVSGVSINTSNQTEGNGLELKDITISNNMFNNLVSRQNVSGDSHNTGEYHFIIVSSSENVSIKSNTLKNEKESLGYGKEPIYLKCTNAVVEKNTIEGSYSGEAVICIKGYTKEKVSIAPKVDVLSNTITGTFFAAIYHTGYGKIKGNTIRNTQAYALSCENYLTNSGHTFIIENNKIELGQDIPTISTGTARSAITLLSYENMPVKAVLKKNRIQSKSQIEIVRCRFAYEIDLDMSNNTIETNGKIVSFANLSGFEKSFKLKAHKKSGIKATAINQPKSSHFDVFNITEE